MMKTYTCVTCPLSCDVVLSVDDVGHIEVSGNRCARGKTYAENEYLAPKRMITTTVRINNAHIPMLPVIGNEPVPKELLRECLNMLYSVTVDAPVKMGDVVVPNILNTGVDILAARSL